MVGPHEIELTDSNGTIEKVTSNFICIAVGGRPNFPQDVPNIEKLSITSDDLF